MPMRYRGIISLHSRHFSLLNTAKLVHVQPSHGIHKPQWSIATRPPHAHGVILRTQRSIYVPVLGGGRCCEGGGGGTRFFTAVPPRSRKAGTNVPLAPSTTAFAPRSRMPIGFACGWRGGTTCCMGGFCPQPFGCWCVVFGEAAAPSTKGLLTSGVSSVVGSTAPTAGSAAMSASALAWAVRVKSSKSLRDMRCGSTGRDPPSLTASDSRRVTPSRTWSESISGGCMELRGW
mmetsp:Transcript_20838/g.67552  ORF Transcript_20838/g.67552 Transcript_20838/m.67552 type:complete len:232 (+) Transcript_20838:189-884(+)